MRRHTRSLGCALVVALSAICISAPAAGAAAPCEKAPPAGGDWPSYGHDFANTRTQPAEHGIGPSAAASLKPAWTFSTSSAGDSSGFDSTPVVSGGCAFVGSTGGFTYALDTASGHLVWKRQVDVFNQSNGGSIVSAPAVTPTTVIYLVSGAQGPYAIALDRSTGAVVWKTPPWLTGTFSGGTQSTYLTVASPIVVNGLVVAGYNSPEGNTHGSGGFALIDAGTGQIVKLTPTIPPADQAKGYAGGGLWSSPAYDPSTGYAYWGSGNPDSRQQEHPNTNAILKIDLDRSRATFGEIVASYKGNVDQYSSTLAALSHTPACAASDNPSLTYPLDDPVCGQIDLDFGASANLFTTSDGTKVVGELQKSGVYHVARADTMKPAWTALVGASCFPCNAASTAYYNKSIYGVGEPQGTVFSIARDNGATNWLQPLGDGPHYESTSAADGVVWMVDNWGDLTGFDAGTGQPLARRPIAADIHGSALNVTSSGVAIAEHKLFVDGGGVVYNPTPGFVVAYQP